MNPSFYNQTNICCLTLLLEHKEILMVNEKLFEAILNITCFPVG